MSVLIKMCLDGKEYNRAYIDICIYDNEIVALPDVISQITTSLENTQVIIEKRLIRKYEILNESARIKVKLDRNRENFNLVSDHCKLIIYPKETVNYRGEEFNCYAVLVWHVDRDLLKLIDNSCKF